MTHADVQAWLDRYVEAWLSYSPDAIGALFSETAEYRYHPWDEPIRGREAIIRSWLEPAGAASSRDAEGTYDGRYEPWAVDGDRALALGWSKYWTDASRAELRDVYDNAWLLEFDGDGLCRSFVEFYMERPASKRA